MQALTLFRDDSIENNDSISGKKICFLSANLQRNLLLFLTEAPMDLSFHANNSRLC